jgi:hypothetical protein
MICRDDISFVMVTCSSCSAFKLWTVFWLLYIWVDGMDEVKPVRSAYQPPTNSTFLSEQTSHQQPANSTFLSEQISTSHQPPAKRIIWESDYAIFQYYHRTIGSNNILSPSQTLTASLDPRVSALLSSRRRHHTDPPEWRMDMMHLQYKPGIIGRTARG